MRHIFWNEIMISLQVLDDPETHRKLGEHNVLDILCKFLECNRGYPFTFELLLRGSGTGSPYLAAILDRLIAESQRWRKATMVLRSSEISELYRVKNRLQQLESLVLHISGCETSDNSVPKSFADLFDDTPLLTRMTINPISTWEFDWSNMKLLEFIAPNHGIDLIRLPIVLSRAMRLEQLIIVGDVAPPCDAPIMLSSLRSLMIDGVGLLSVIATPGLEELSLNIFVETSETAEIVQSFFYRSQCQIKNLKLQNSNALLAMCVFMNAPEITHLYLKTISHVVEIWKWLVDMHREGTPQLTCLQSLTICSRMQPELDYLFELIALRNRRIEDGGSIIIQKLHQVAVHRHQQNDDLDRELQRIMTQCKENDVEYLDIVKEETRIWQAHDRSQDPYDFLLYLD
ncbi:hypothetical protein APHAL10511_003324 [Amanita phalloides]|nr:hypothetical protein APHAL10511_003324 [Amanita phalloides]